MTSKNKNDNMLLILSLYFNYAFQGVAAIIISQNLDALTSHWSATVSQVMSVVSVAGVGRIISSNVSGIISDKYGRKATVLIGTLSYILYFIGILTSKSYTTAMFWALFSGFGNSFLDSSTYPVVSEAFPSESDSSSLSVLNKAFISILNKAFISIGQFILPFITRFLKNNGHYYGWAFILSAVLLIVNLSVLFKLKFPKQTKDCIEEAESQQVHSGQSTQVNQAKASFRVEGIALLIFSFVSVSLFNVFIYWIPTFAESYLNINSGDSALYVSIYSVASFIAVFFTSYITKKGINVPKYIFTCCIIVGLSVTYMVLAPSKTSVLIACISIGVFAAGGIWQLGLSLMLDLFPNKKGLYTSHYSLATAISVAVSPYMTGLMVELNLMSVFIYIIILSVVGCIAISVVGKRYNAVIKNKANVINHDLNSTVMVPQEVEIRNH